jgi:triosephosphate isomerase
MSSLAIPSAAPITLAEREMGVTLEVIRIQLAGSVPPGGGPLVIAYEPVWAIGTGLVPTTDQIGEVHADIRARLAGIDGVQADNVPLLYGGSVKPDNAASIFAVGDVDGALVGGASLKPSDFGQIVTALASAIR